MLDTFTIGRQDIPDFIEDINNRIRSFLQNNYPDADIYATCELNRLFIPLLGDIIELYIELQYFDAEITDSQGNRVFNEGNISFLAPDYIEDVELEFFYIHASSTDPNTFFPNENTQNSLEKQLGDFIFY